MKKKEPVVKKTTVRQPATPPPPAPVVSASKAPSRTSPPPAPVKAPKLAPARKTTPAPAPARAAAPAPAPAPTPAPTALIKEHFTDSELRSVSFAYFNPAAGEVFVVGAFNDWEPRATPMSKKLDGQWTANILLKPGQYEYRFVVDGAWQDDPMSGRYVSNPFGGLNAVLEVLAIDA